MPGGALEKVPGRAACPSLWGPTHLMLVCVSAANCRMVAPLRPMMMPQRLCGTSSLTSRCSPAGGSRGCCCWCGCCCSSGCCCGWSSCSLLLPSDAAGPVGGPPARPPPAAAAIAAALLRGDSGATPSFESLLNVRLSAATTCSAGAGRVRPQPLARRSALLPLPTAPGWPPHAHVHTHPSALFSFRTLCLRRPPDLLQPAREHEYALHRAREVLAGLGQLDFGVRLLLEVVDIAASLWRARGGAGPARGHAEPWTACRLPLRAATAAATAAGSAARAPPARYCVVARAPTLPMMEPAAAFDTSIFTYTLGLVAAAPAGRQAQLGASTAARRRQPGGGR